MKKLLSLIGSAAVLSLAAPALTFAQAASTDTPLGRVTNFGELVSLVWAYGSQVLIVMAVFFVVLGAFFYIASAGNEDRIAQGKEMIFGSLIAIVIVLTSGILMRTLHKTTAGTTGALSEVPQVIANATNVLIGLIGAFTILMLVYAALLYILARGDTDRIQKAHRAFRYGIIGLVIGVLAYAIVNAVVKFLI